MNSQIAKISTLTNFLLLLTTLQYAAAQTYVVDPGLATTLTFTHFQQQSLLKDIQNEESNIKAFQLLVQDRMNEIRKLQEKTYKYLSTVNAVVRNGKDIIYASQIAKDIKNYIIKASNLVGSNPKLALLVAKTEYEFANRALDLIMYINNVALIGGESNLLDNKQRIDLCIYVVNELREMRALAYSIYRQMRSVQKDGVIRTLAPAQFKYVYDSKRTADRILKDLKYISKGGRYL